MSETSSPDTRRKTTSSSLVERVIGLIDGSATVPSLDTLAQAVGVSKYHLQRRFKAAMGVSPHAYASERRAARIRQSLQDSEDVTSAIYAAGYEEASTFYEEAPRRLGMAPSHFSNKGAAMDIQYAITDSPLGYLLVAATQRGVCALTFGDSKATLIDDLHQQFSKANSVSQGDGLTSLITTIVTYLEEPTGCLSLPLDVRGTAFQQRVWKTLQEIPAGTTLSYAQLATRIGSPNASRAVARACATNPVAVAIPCHRIIRGDGTLSGYRWGIERKAELLEREARGILEE